MEAIYKRAYELYNKGYRFTQVRKTIQDEYKMLRTEAMYIATRCLDERE